MTGNSAGLLTGVGGTVRFIDQNKQDPRVQQWSFDVQRELPGNMALTIGYLGSRGDKLGLGGTNDAAVNINQLDPSLQSMGSALLQEVPNPFFGVAAAGGLASLPTIERGQLLRPFPQFRDVLALQTTEGKSRYNALTFQLDKRVSSGWGGRLAYTFSQLKDNQFAETNFYTNRAGSAPLNNYDLEAEYALGILDVPHKISLAPIVELPFGQGKKYMNEPGVGDLILGGWSISGIITFESGYPIGIGSDAEQRVRLHVDQRQRAAAAEHRGRHAGEPRQHHGSSGRRPLGQPVSESGRVVAGGRVHVRKRAAHRWRRAVAVPDQLGHRVQQVVPDRWHDARRLPDRDPELLQPAEVRRVQQLDVRELRLRPCDDAGRVHANLAAQLPVRVLDHGLPRITACRAEALA